MKAKSETAVQKRRRLSAGSAPSSLPRDKAVHLGATPLAQRTGEFGTSTADLENLLVSTNLAVLLLDRRQNIRRFTPAATALFAIRPGDVGRSIRDFAQNFTDPAFLPDVMLVLEGKTASKKEVQTSEGRWYVRQTLPYLLRHGPIKGVVITFSDVAADALQQARLYAESIVNTVREPLLVLDSDLCVHSINQPFSALFQVSIEDVLGRSLRDLDKGVWDVPDLLSLLKGIVDNGGSMEDFEITYEAPPQGRRMLCLNARTLRRGSDAPDLLLVAIEDITERLRIQKLLHDNEARLGEEERVRQRQLELTNALRVSTVGELAAGLAHELNQPLSSISIVVEACAQHVRSGIHDPAQLLELLADAANESVRAAGIVAHLRSFVDKGEPQFEPVDLGEVVGNVPHLLLRELERNRIVLRIEPAADQLPVQADRIQLEQVIVNLIQNAMDSIQEAGGTERRIELSVGAVDGMGEVRVRDTGTGVSEPAAERMFQAFYTTKAQGLGMGLALSRSILEAHRGRIWMEAPSDGGRGTVVCFSIPLR